MQGWTALLLILIYLGLRSRLVPTSGGAPYSVEPRLVAGLGIALTLPLALLLHRREAGVHHEDFTRLASAHSRSSARRFRNFRNNIASLARVRDSGDSPRPRALRSLRRTADPQLIRTKPTKWCPPCPPPSATDSRLDAYVRF
jgi:hypothetical protein